MLNDNDVWVFGSNTAGRHGKGAALFAKENYGAINGKGFGLQGRSFAIPTKDSQLQPLPLKSIRVFIAEFILFAKARPDLRFEVTRVGCGLAGYKDTDIAPLFKNAPENCMLPERWREITNGQESH